jgi:hypothetical protein
MKRIFLLFPFLLGLLFAQEVSEKDPASQFAATITTQDMQAHLGFLADDLLEGRETGERGQHLAALYIETHFRRIGLQPGAKAQGYQQPFVMAKSKIENIKISFRRKEFVYRTDFFTFGAHGIPNKLEGEFVFAGYGMSEPEYNNLQGLELEGKIAVALAGGPEEAQGNMRSRIRGWFDRSKAFKEAGAKALFMILNEDAYKRIIPYAPRSSLVMTGENTSEFPVFYLSTEMGAELLKTAKADAEELKAALKNNPSPPALKFSKLAFSYKGEVEANKIKSGNVLGYLEGTDKKDELLVITGHYDHLGIRKDKIYNGADDDGSGTTAVLELAEAFALAAQNGYRPRRSILFMTVAGEEKGLLGSEFYVDHPIYPLENTVTNLNIDMIGRTDDEYAQSDQAGNYVYVIGADKLSSELNELHEDVNKKYAGITLDYRYNDEKDPNRYYYRSDHYNFAKNDIPVIFYFTGTHKDYHRPTDTVEKIEFEKMQKITRLVFHTAWEIANRDERPKVDKKPEAGK